MAAYTFHPSWSIGFVVDHGTCESDGHNLLHDLCMRWFYIVLIVRYLWVDACKVMDIWLRRYCVGRSGQRKCHQTRYIVNQSRKIKETGSYHNLYEYKHIYSYQIHDSCMLCLYSYIYTQKIYVRNIRERSTVSHVCMISGDMAKWVVPNAV